MLRLLSPCSTNFRPISDVALSSVKPPGNSTFAFVARPFLTASVARMGLKVHLLYMLGLTGAATWLTDLLDPRP